MGNLIRTFLSAIELLFILILLLLFSLLSVLGVYILYDQLARFGSIDWKQPSLLPLIFLAAAFLIFCTVQSIRFYRKKISWPIYSMVVVFILIDAYVILSAGPLRK